MLLEVLFGAGRRDGRVKHEFAYWHQRQESLPSHHPRSVSALASCKWLILFVCGL